MFNKKSVSHRRQATIVFGYNNDDFKKREKRIEQYNLETNKCKNLSIHSLIIILEDLNPHFFSISESAKELFRITKRYKSASSVFARSFDDFSVNYFIQIENNKIILSSDNKILFECEESLFTLKEIAVQIMEKINDNFYSKIEASDFLIIRVEKINEILKNFCQSYNISFVNIDCKDITREEILNKEIKVMFKMKDIVVEEYIDIYVSEKNLDMLEDTLKSKYSIKEAEKIEILLKENDFSHEYQNKKRL